MPRHALDAGQPTPVPAQDVAGGLNPKELLAKLQHFNISVQLLELFSNHLQQ